MEYAIQRARTIIRCQVIFLNAKFRYAENLCFAIFNSLRSHYSVRDMIRYREEAFDERHNSFSQL